MQAQAQESQTGQERTRPRTRGGLSQAPTQPVNRRKRRRKPGVAALREIRKYQTSTELLIKRNPFLRLLKEVTQKTEKNMR